MKRIAILVMLVALLAIGASAVQISNPTLGNDRQDRVKNVISSFLITNNNTDTMTGIAITAGAGATDVKYALSFSNIPASLGPGASVTITVNGTIPLDHSSVNPTTLREEPVKIGTVTVSGTVNGSANSATADIFMQAINQVRIKKARIDCGTKSQSLSDGDRVKNLKPGDDCTLEVEVENLFDNNDRDSQKIGDISFDTVTVKVNSRDANLDVNEGDDINSLNSGDTDTSTSDVTIDDSADGTLTLDISVSGRDANGALHGEARQVHFEVKRLTHDLQIRRVDLVPNVISNCQASNAKLTVNVLNQGKRNEKNVVVEAIASDIAFTKKADNIQLDKDDSTSAAFDIAIPKGAKEGVVRVDVKTYFDTTAPSNSGSVDLAISKCSDETSADTTMTQEEPKKQTTVVVPQQPVTPAGQSQAAPKKQTSFTEGKAYVGLLAVLSVLIAAAIVALVVIMVRRKRE